MRSSRTWWLRRHSCNCVATKSSCPSGVPSTRMPNCSVGNPEPRHTNASGSVTRAIRSSVSQNPGLTRPEFHTWVLPSFMRMREWTHNSRCTVPYIQIVVKRQQPFFIVQRTLDCGECSMLTQCEQQGHHWVPLFSSFTLFDAMDMPFVIFPKVGGSLPVEHPDKRYRRRPTFNAHQCLQHGLARNQIECSNSVDGHHCCG